jgi:hypothetical protein
VLEEEEEEVVAPGGAPSAAAKKRKAKKKKAASGTTGAAVDAPPSAAAAVAASDATLQSSNALVEEVLARTRVLKLSRSTVEATIATMFDNGQAYNDVDAVAEVLLEAAGLGQQHTPKVRIVCVHGGRSWEGGGGRQGWRVGRGGARGGVGVRWLLVVFCCCGVVDRRPQIAPTRIERLHCSIPLGPSALLTHVRHGRGAPWVPMKVERTYG